jgi:anaerobic sulfite reductase subunit B
MSTTELPVTATAAALVPSVWRVADARRETVDTVTLDLLPSRGVQPIAPAPGQFTMLSLFGLGEAAVSVSGDPARPLPLRQTVRAAGALTTALTRLEPGDAVGVRGPFGTGWDLDAATGRDVLVAAGGLGFAPLRPVVYALRHRRQAGRLTVLLGARTPADLLYAEELRRWAFAADLELHITVDRPSSGWSGHVGVVTSLLRRAELEPARTSAYVCGPEVMMRFTAAALADLGVPASLTQLSLERTMRCGVGLCGHCQLGPYLVCRDGPVLPYDRVRGLLSVREL